MSLRCCSVKHRCSHVKIMAADQLLIWSTEPKPDKWFSLYRVLWLLAEKSHKSGKFFLTSKRHRYAYDCGCLYGLIFTWEGPSDNSSVTQLHVPGRALWCRGPDLQHEYPGIWDILWYVSDDWTQFQMPSKYHWFRFSFSLNRIYDKVNRLRS